MSETSQIIIRVPSKTKQDLQIIAIKKHTNMNEIINQLIQDYVNKNK